MARNEPIARIGLARSLPRLLAWPAILLGLALGLGVVAVVIGGGPALVLGILGGLLGLAGIAWAARLLSVRLDVEESEIRVHWMGGERRYVLSPGPVTRVRFRGENASPLRVRRGFLGYGLGPARLREDEEIHVVRLAPTTTAILVPTEEGRVAIAADDESTLLDALSRAARARQRLDDIARRPGSDAPSHPVEVDEPEGDHAIDDRTEAPATVEPAPPAEAAPFEGEARQMTGIERMLYERRLAEDRALAEAEAAAAEAAAAELEAARRLAGADEATPAAMPAPPSEVTEPVTDVSAEPRRTRAITLPRPRLGGIPARHAMAVVPLVGAIAAWAIGVTIGEMPDPGSDLGRLTAVALVLAGPATSLGAIVARLRWPQVVGVVVMSGLATSVLIGRVLLGL